MKCPNCDDGDYDLVCRDCDLHGWISVEKRLPDCEKVLAIYVSKKNTFYNMRHDGWFRDTIYACRMYEGKFIIESHGPYIPATHWMPLPQIPRE